MRRLIPMLRFVAEVVLLPFRLAAGITGLIFTTAGALGAIAWTIQLLIGGNGRGPLSPGRMWLACIAAVPAGLLLLALATTRKITEPPAQPIPGDSPPPKRREQLAPDVIDTGTGLTLREIPAGVFDEYLAALDDDPDLEPVRRTPDPYHRPERPRLRHQTRRRPQ